MSYRGRAFEGLQIFLGLRDQRDIDNEVQVQPEHLGAETGSVALDHPGLLQLQHPR